MKQAITLLCISFFFSTSAQVGQNMLMYYDFNGQVHDITGQGYDGIEHNVTYVPDRFGIENSACHFNGIDSYIELPDVQQFKPELPVSFAFWVKYDSTNYQKQVVFNTSFENNRSTGIWFNSTSSTGQYAINFGDGTYAYTPETRRTFVSNAVIEVTQWHHIAVVVNSATDMEIFVDKIPISGTYSGTGGDLAYSLTPGCLGRHDRDLGAPADYFEGALDDVHYWARKITPEEVAMAYDGITLEQLALPNIDHEAIYFNMYPNPASNILHLASNIEGLKTISIFNTFGQKVYDSVYTPEINVGNLSKGIYFITAEGNDSKITKKIVVR